MAEGDDIDIFVQQLEVALLSEEIPNDKWKSFIHSQLTLNAKQKVIHLLQQPDATYDEIRAGLMGSSSMTFAATAEAIFTADKGKIQQLPGRQAVEKINRWIDKLIEGTTTLKEAGERFTVGVARSLLTPELKLMWTWLRLQTNRNS